MATILVVDDDATNRRLLRAVLGPSGYRVVEAANGAEGLGLALAERPDLVMADVLMPKMDGYEFVHRLRAEPATAACAVVFYTAAFAESEVRRLGETCGVHHVLRKPCEPDLVLRTVEAALAESPRPPAPVADAEFRREHLAILNDKLIEQIRQLEAANLERERIQAQREQERAAFEARLLQTGRLESIGQLAGGVAHDFNNLLAAIMNYGGLVSRTISEQMVAHGLTGDEAFIGLAQDMEEILKVAKRAADLTRQLLIFGRREVIKPEVLDLNTVVDDMGKLLRRTISEDIDLRTTLEPRLPRAKLDRSQIEQVLMNLVVNARDAMPGGGVIKIETAAFEADEGYAHLHGIRPGVYVQLTVSDSGSGMSPEVAARAFEPFFTTKPKGEGTGLGLATVYGIVTQAGGDVVIYSEPGLGTTIRLNFPVSEDEPTGAPEPAPERLLASKGETILLVEDEGMVRESARRILVRHGYKVLTACGAEEGLRVAADHPESIDLLLTDVVMPGRSGRELASELAGKSPDTRVLYMSGYSQDIVVHQGVVDEGINLIEKPFAAGSLLEKIRSILDLR